MWHWSAFSAATGACDFNCQSECFGRRSCYSVYGWRRQSLDCILTRYLELLRSDERSLETGSHVASSQLLNTFKNLTLLVTCSTFHLQADDVLRIGGGGGGHGGVTLDDRRQVGLSRHGRVLADGCKVVAFDWQRCTEQRRRLVRSSCCIWAQVETIKFKSFAFSIKFQFLCSIFLILA